MVDASCKHLFSFWIFKLFFSKTFLTIVVCMSSNTNANRSAYEGAVKGGDTNFRKEWDKDEYEKKAKEREAEVKRKGTVKWARCC